MYSFHPFGGIETHPYGGSMGALPSFQKMQDTATGVKTTAEVFKDAARSFSPTKRSKPTMPKVGTGASPKAFTAVALNMANVNATLKNFQKLQARGVVPTFATAAQLAQEPAYLEQPYMGEGGASEGGFFETYKNYIIIGGAIAVVGAFALYMRNR